MSRRYIVALAAIAAVGCQDALGPVSSSAIAVKATASLSAPVVFFGPERFTRQNGAPQTETRTISTVGFEAPFTLRVTSSGVTSGSVSLDGVELLGTNDFKNNAGPWAFTVTPGATATLTVQLASKPGSYIDVSLEGKRSATIFCTTPVPGGYTNLQDAINATDAGGTILVCDGLHTADSVTIDRPLTLRSQNPGGARLADAGSGPSGQGSRAAIYIDGVASGLVRFADIGFEVRKRAIVPRETFDRVEIDSVTFIGVPAGTAIMVNPQPNLVSTAKVEVTNSSFTDVSIGVFVTTSAETNVRNNTFTNFASGSATYSGNAPAFNANGVMENNVVSGCPVLGCIRSFATNQTIRNNYIDATGATSKSGAIVFSRVSMPVSGQIVIENNTILGNFIGGSPGVLTSWSIQAGVSFSDAAAGGAIIRGNTITNSHSGVVASIFGATTVITMHDNFITNAFLAFRRNGSVGTMTANRNDFLGINTNTFTTAHPTGFPPAPGNYSCNWWGTPAGQNNPQVAPGNPPLPTSMWQPPASAPIAGQPGVACP
jgi:hypothetical protein